MWFFSKKAKKKGKGVVRARAPKSAEGGLFAHTEEIRTLRAEGDPRWLGAAYTDLREAAQHEEGLERLAQAVSAMLRKK
jgi:hypothetical protein